MKALLILSLITTFAAANEQAFNPSLDYAQVSKVVASQSVNGDWCFNVTVHHNDQGWEHYADGWEVLDLQANVIAQRVLAHPHDNEQPFTRSKCNIQIPEEISKVIIQAQCNQHGIGGQTITVDLKIPQNEKD